MKIGLLVIGIVLYLKQMDHDQRLVWRRDRLWRGSARSRSS